MTQSCEVPLILIFLEIAYFTVIFANNLPIQTLTLQTMEAALYFVYKSGIAFFPIIGYLFQYKLIQQRQQIGTFSIKVCGILLFSATLKIAFYLFKHFSKALLVQAMLMITVQLCLLRLCLNVMHKQGYFLEKGDQKRQVHKESFWRWKNRLNYVYTIVGVAAVIFAISYLVRTFKLTVLGQMLGYGATCIETTILLPQLLENLKQSRVKGVSYTFVLLNTAQDVNELLFVSVIEPQPLQFILLNGVQSLADLLLITQIIFYKLFHKPIIQELIEEVVPSAITAEINQKRYEQEGKEHVSMNSQDVVVDKEGSKSSSNDSNEQRENVDTWTNQQGLQIEPSPIDLREQQKKQAEGEEEDRSEDQENSSGNRELQQQKQQPAIEEGKVSSTDADQQ